MRFNYFANINKAILYKNAINQIFLMLVNIEM